VGKIDDVVAELLDQRLVQPKFDAHFLDCLRRSGGSREIGRRIAWQQSGEQKRDNHDTDQARDRHRHAFDDQCHHGT